MPTEHQLLLFWLQLLALLFTARVLGGGLRAIGQPAVIGELAAGLVLGPSVFGHLSDRSSGSGCDACGGCAPTTAQNEPAPRKEHGVFWRKSTR